MDRGRAGVGRAGVDRSGRRGMQGMPGRGILPPGSLAAPLAHEQQAGLEALPFYPHPTPLIIPLVIPPPPLSPSPQGFSATLNAIVANIPRQRQTLLFSATQTKSVKDLARLSLKVGGPKGVCGWVGAWRGGGRAAAGGLPLGAVAAVHRVGRLSVAGGRVLSTEWLPQRLAHAHHTAFPLPTPAYSTHSCPPSRTRSMCLCTPRRRRPPPSSCSRPSWSVSCRRSWTSCGASSRRT